MWDDLALIIGAYLLGSIPHLLLLAKLSHVKLNGDFHQSLWHKGGRIYGTTGMLGEFAKGIVPVLIGKCLDFSLLTVALAGLAAVIGQMWPIFSRFDGEKGNSIAIPMTIALTPRPALLAIIPIIISLIVRTTPRLIHSSESSGKGPIIGGAYSRSLPLGVAVAFLLLPFVSWWLGEPVEVEIVYSALFVLIMVRRVTADLRSDLRPSHDTRGVLLNRLLYDRTKMEWRKSQIKENQETSKNPDTDNAPVY